MSNPVIESVRKALGNETKTGDRPPVLAPRKAGDAEAEINIFMQELSKLSGVGLRLERGEIGQALKDLVTDQKILRATAWGTPLLKELEVEGQLGKLGVEMVSPNANKFEMAGCDLGITEAEYLLPETGTMVLKSSTEKPRGVSLLPRTHLAIVRPAALRADLHQVFAEAKDNHYLVFITGPSRTSDIELTVTLGVHGPKSLFVWMLKN